METHLHLLLEVGESPLSKVMRVLQFRYTRYFNNRYSKVGHLFQGRNKAILCERDAYFLELVRYIHLNPVRGGVVEDPGRYPWTGHLSYMGKGKVDLVDEDFEKQPDEKREEEIPYYRCLTPNAHMDR
jgi:putative transposase